VPDPRATTRETEAQAARPTRRTPAAGIVGALLDPLGILGFGGAGAAAAAPKRARRRRKPAASTANPLAAAPPLAAGADEPEPTSGTDEEESVRAFEERK
jgi:hypothetical protein